MYDVYPRYSGSPNNFLGRLGKTILYQIVVTLQASSVHFYRREFNFLNLRVYSYYESWIFESYLDPTYELMGIHDTCINVSVRLCKLKET
jgi:hypothetical protein